VGTTDRLTQRALNRATLARQHLLARDSRAALEAVEHLVGLQAQVPLDPYTGLWSRLEGFRAEELARLLEDRAVVRTVVMRGTIHLVSGPDCLLLRPLMQPVLDAELARHPEYGPVLRGLDLAPVLAAGRDAMAERPVTGPELRAALAERFPGRDAAALAYACRCLLPVVQVPPRGVWGRSGQVTVTTAERWLGRPLEERPSLDDVVLRYLAAFGPASVADVATWCRLTGLRTIVDRLRPGLRTFRDERGRELVDLPDAPRPDPDTPAPIRFLPEYDNVLLSHADRTRIVPDDRREALRRAGGVGLGSVLHDGFVCAVWRVERDGKSNAATLVVTLVQRLSKRATSAVEAEGRRYLRFAAAGTERREVRIVPLG
jgi:winged helix DNA-binding protein